jgi:hypothetical protein
VSIRFLKIPLDRSGDLSWSCLRFTGQPQEVMPNKTNDVGGQGTLAGAQAPCAHGFDEIAGLLFPACNSSEVQLHRDP